MHNEHSYHREEIIAFSPRSFEDIKTIADEIKNGNPTIINVNELAADNRESYIHFLNGVVYALNGNSTCIGNNVYLFAPPNVEVYNESTD